jgi:acyl-CoA synthetase (AMP-forming)/AMP-acid ligase II
MSSSHQLAQLTLTDFEERLNDRHLLHGVVEKWAREKPSSIALIDSDRKQTMNWATLERMSSALAARLRRSGFNKGDCFASFLPLTSEHILLEIACFKIGVIFVPLDLRLPPAELIRSLSLVQAKGFSFIKIPGAPDPAPLIAQIKSRFELKLLVQLSQPDECVEGATSFVRLAQESLASSEAHDGPIQVDENDGALVIFTTGSTGSPKPALLSHRNIACQAMCISQALLSTGTENVVTLVNLPPSHVGCQTELLMGTFFVGGTAVLLPVFDPLKSMRAIEEFKVTALGQIPALFQFEWRLKDYGSFDLSSLTFAAYGGQQVSPEFLDKMAEMAPSIGTGLGLTETAGFCTYIRGDRAHARQLSSDLGVAMPVYPMTIREPMRPDGTAGAEVASGEVGHVCFKGPQTFLGYMNDPEASAAAVSTDGFLYTGDLGSMDAAGALHLSGRAKWVLKPGGYQVFPADVENHFCALSDQIASCAVVGVAHPIISEAIIAFIEKQPGSQITQQSLEKHARDLATYMRPRHYVLLEPGQMPLNRVAKADYMTLKQMAKEEVDTLKSRGLWEQ